MNGNGEYSDVQESYSYLRGEYVTGIDFGSAYPGGFYPDISLGGIYPGFAAYGQLPAVRVLPFPAGPGNGDAEAVGGPELSEAGPAQVIDPGYETSSTVYESAPGGIYETNRAPTDWDEVYRQYVILNAPEAEVFHESIDWGGIAGGIIGGIFDPFGAGAATTSFFQPQQVVSGLSQVPQMGGPVTTGITPMQPGAACPPVGPKYAKICLATNVITPLRRRRRRRLLTSSDIKDLAALKAIVGGAALQGAVVQAIRR